jgi:chorismate dehydratase
LIPSIAYLEQPDYRLVPGVAVGSRGAVASVALFTRVNVAGIRRLALDTSSRTSVGLIKVLCARRFHIAPDFVPASPHLEDMLARADAALVIGDPALEIDPGTVGGHKIDLGTEWTAMTGLPFVYAAWAGRPGAVNAEDVRLLQSARTAGEQARELIAAEYGRGDAAVTVRASAYLRDNVRYGLGDEETAGLQLFLDYVSDLGLAQRRTVEFF